MIASPRPGRAAGSPGEPDGRRVYRRHDAEAASGTGVALDAVGHCDEPEPHDEIDP